MTDISPQLYEAIKTEFEKRVAGNSAIKYVLDGINSGEFDSTRYGYQYSELIGTALASSFQKVLSSNVLPDGKMYYNIAKSVVEPFLKENYEATAAVATQIQQTLFDKAGIGLKPITPKVNQDKIDGIINRLDSEPDFDKVKWILNEPVVNYTQSAMDDSIQQNVNFQGRAGLSPSVTRIVARKCCDWCAALAGKYPYPEVPDDVYRRHENCRCMVEFIPNKGMRQNVWTKEIYEVDESLEGSSDFMGKGNVETIVENGKQIAKFKTYKNSNFDNIWVQTNSSNSQEISKYLNDHLNTGRPETQLDRIVVAKKDSLGGIAVYNHENNVFYISEELINDTLFSQIVDFDYFPARNIDDVVTHEIDGHKAHWSAVERAFASGKYQTIADAKQAIEQPLREYVSLQINGDRKYLNNTVSENAYSGFTYKKSLNEVIADVKILMKRGELTDSQLGSLVEELLSK